jgi:hypothetical protein
MRIAGGFTAFASSFAFFGFFASRRCLSFDMALLPSGASGRGIGFSLHGELLAFARDVSPRYDLNPAAGPRFDF